MKKNEQELLFSVTLQDCRVECLASRGGNGGQNKNRRHTAVRITHPPSGAVGFSGEENDQLRNKRTAFRRMAETSQFQVWARSEAARRSGQKSVDQLVDEAMAPELLVIEGRDESGCWTKLVD